MGIILIQTKPFKVLQNIFIVTQLNVFVLQMQQYTLSKSCVKMYYHIINKICTVSHPLIFHEDLWAVFNGLPLPNRRPCLNTYINYYNQIQYNCNGSGFPNAYKMELGGTRAHRYLNCLLSISLLPPLTWHV